VWKGHKKTREVCKTRSQGQREAEDDYPSAEETRWWLLRETTTLCSLRPEVREFPCLLPS
jgi:hypothetical protein